MRTVTIFGEHNGSYAMMAKPIRALELHYPMIPFLIITVYLVAGVEFQ